MATSFRPSALTFAPHFEDRVWGGRELERYGRELPAGRTIGESWEVSAIAGRSSVVTAGPYRGQDLETLLCEHRDEIVGPFDPAAGAFPLLVKLLDAAEPLSVQLHPRDDEARRLEGPGDGKLGKTEAWIVLDAAPGAEVIHGLAPGVSSESLYARVDAAGGAALGAEAEQALLRRVVVRRGDIVFVPAGTIHALGAGVVLAEVQQHSDITYRIYDWGRRAASGESRELHVEKARRVRDAAPVDCPLLNLADIRARAELTPVLDCAQFHFDLLALAGSETRAFSTKAPGVAPGFHLWMSWEGEIECRGPSGARTALAPVEFVLLPAALGAYEMAARGPASAILVRAGARQAR